MINNFPITTSPIKNTIHPEIEAFWTEQGYTVSSIAIEMPSGEKKYRLGCFWYSEAEMLRMIKLKAWL